MSDIKLKPCPFCGGDKLKLDKKSKLVGFNGLSVRVENWTYSVRCNTCHARGGAIGGKVAPFNKILDEQPKGLTTIDELKRKAIEKWNTRKPMDRIVEQLEEILKPKEFYFCRVNKGACNHLEDDIICMDCAIQKAIEIVKAGGVDG